MKVNFTQSIGPVKIMHAVNNGPMRRKPDQTLDNYDSYKALKIPYARNHDASFNADYGGSHTVDVANIFPNFDADVNDPASYDFVLTDEYIERTLEVGTETFYRLGAKIEHEIKKYNTLPPKDFKKWAEICEHIIRHMNEGWADGHHFNIQYWEIWNEADGAADDDSYYMHKCWGGTEAQFHDFYEIVAKHLKKCFPDLKIGGTAVCWPNDWLDRFLADMHKRRVPMDFVSWHTYTTDPHQIALSAKVAQTMMKKNGYGKAENILDEWNYVRNWTDQFVYSIETINNVKGAAFTAACMMEGQHSPVHMMMYYDARPTVWCGMWNYYTARPQPTYYALDFFSRLYQMGNEVKCTGVPADITAMAATDGNGQSGILLSTYTEDDEDKRVRRVTIHLEGTPVKSPVVTIVDPANPAPIKKDMLVIDGALSLSLKPNSVVFVAC